MVELKKEKKSAIIAIIIIFIIFFAGIIICYCINQIPKDVSFEIEKDVRHKLNSLKYEMKEDYQFGYYVEEKQYSFKLSDEKHYCCIDIYRDASVDEDYLQKEIKNDFNYKTTTKDINGKTWYYSSIERKHYDNFYTESNYRIYYDKALYQVMMYDYKDTDERCKKDFEEFINSLKFE